ncbi:MAG: hypothetical protein AAGI46_02110 [Planctomycetota bacterium]
MSEEPDLQRPKRPARPAAPAGAKRPSRPTGNDSPRPAKNRPAKPKPGVEAARTTIPTCLVLAVFLPLFALIRLAAPSDSGWATGPASLSWLMLLVGLIAAAGAFLLMRFVQRQTAPAPARARRGRSASS